MIENGEKIKYLLFFFASDSGFYRQSGWDAWHDFVQKSLYQPRVWQHAGAPPLFCDHGGRAPQVPVHGVEAKVVECCCQLNESRRIIADDLRNNRHPVVVFRQNILDMGAVDLFCRKRIDKRGNSGVNPFEMDRIEIPVKGICKAPEGGEREKQGHHGFIFLGFVFLQN